MRSLVFVVALLGLCTGCSLLPGAKDAAAVTAEPDPWVGFNNGYAKGEKPAAPAPKPEEKVEKVASADEKTADEDAAPAPKPAKKKPVAKKKAAKKKPAAAVAAKKPRKRAKKS